MHTEQSRMVPSPEDISFIATYNFLSLLEKLNIRNVWLRYNDILDNISNYGPTMVQLRGGGGGLN